MGLNWKVVTDVADANQECGLFICVWSITKSCLQS